MKSALLIASVAFGVTGCATNDVEKRTAVGAAVGAAAGAAISGDTLTGAATGTAIGAFVGALVKPPSRTPPTYYRDTTGYCYYIDKRGRAIYNYKITC